MDVRNLVLWQIDQTWKTVGEYLDNELPDNDEDAKKMKEAEKGAQRNIADARASKMAKIKTPSSRSSSRATQHISIPGRR